MVVRGSRQGKNGDVPFPVDLQIGVEVHFNAPERGPGCLLVGAAILGRTSFRRYSAISFSEIMFMADIDPSSTVSTRRQTRETGKFVRSTPGSHSLERGLQLLRAFRPGASLLTNAELAERTGLPRPTVSRLARTLVDMGFLTHDAASRGYRLGLVVTSLANTFRHGVPVLEVASPLMRKVAEGERINVGLSAADQLEMVYLESVRESRRGVFRTAPRGSRFPIESTAGGRSYLAGLPRDAREELLGRIAPTHGAAWRALRRHIDRSRTDIDRTGYCVASWQPGLTVVGAPLHGPDHELYALSIGFHATEDQQARLIGQYAPMLLRLVEEIGSVWAARHRALPL